MSDKHASFTDYAEGGGLWASQAPEQVKVTKARAEQFQYRDRDGRPTGNSAPGYVLEFALSDGSVQSEFYSAGGSMKSPTWKPSTDGKFIEPVDAAVWKGATPKLNRHAGAALLTKSVVDSGFPLDRLEIDGIAAIEGADFTVFRETVLDFKGQPRVDDSGRDKTVVLIRSYNGAITPGATPAPSVPSLIHGKVSDAIKTLLESGPLSLGQLQKEVLGNPPEGTTAIQIAPLFQGTAFLNSLGIKVEDGMARLG